MDFFAKLADNRIREAIEAGDFDDLQGKGQPLNLEDDSHIPPELRMAYKILKNADCLPPELVLRQEVVQLQDLVAAMPDEAEKLKQMRRLNFLMMKLNMMRPVSPRVAGARPLHSQGPGTPGVEEIAISSQPSACRVRTGATMAFAKRSRRRLCHIFMLDVMQQGNVTFAGPRAKTCLPPTSYG